MYRLYQIICLLLIIGFLPLTAHALNRQKVMMGARPLGMGGAFIAVANDAHAINWNPAGLSLLRHPEVRFTYVENRFGVGINHSSLEMATPLFARFATGLGYTAYLHDDGELRYEKNKINISFATPLFWGLSLGMNGKWITTEMGLDGQRLDRATGRGIDWGLLYNYKDRFHAAFVWEDVNGSRVSYDRGDQKEIILPEMFRWGASLKFFNEKQWQNIKISDPIIGVEACDYLSVGSEFRLFNILSLRDGIKKELKNDEPVAFYGGLGLRLPIQLIPNFDFVQLDYAYEQPPVLPANHFISLALTGRPASVRLHDVTIPNIHASQHINQKDQLVAHLEIENESGKAISCFIKIQVPMDLGGSTMIPYHQQQEILEPKRITTKDVKIPLPSSIIEFDDDVQQRVDISITYESESLAPITHRDRFIIFGRGKCIWESAETLALFITPQNRWIEQFARVATSDQLIGTELPFNVLSALQLYNALKATGIKYHPDKTIAYHMTSQITYNTVKYPAELLTQSPPVGDCDDLAALYISLLENRGIATAILSFPDELLIMFDSGLTTETKTELRPYLLDHLEFIERDNRLWVPIEVKTIHGLGFFEAWEKGLESYRQNPEIIYSEDAQVKYPSTNYTPRTLPRIPNKSQIRRWIGKDMSVVEMWRLEYNRTVREENMNQAYEQAYQTALEKLTEGLLEEGIAALEEALRLRPQAEEIHSRLVTAWASLGESLIVDGHWEAAINAFETAKKYTEDDSILDQRIQYIHNLLKYMEYMQQAQSLYENKEYLNALNIVREALKYRDTSEARVLQRNIQNKIKEMTE